MKNGFDLDAEQEARRAAIHRAFHQERGVQPVDDPANGLIQAIIKSYADDLLAAQTSLDQLDAAEKSVRQATRTYQAALARFQVDLRQAHRSMGNLDRNGKQQFADLAIHFRDFQADIIHRCLKRSGMVALRVIGGLCPTCNHYTPPRNPPIAIY